MLRMLLIPKEQSQILHSVSSEAFKLLFKVMMVRKNGDL